MCSRVEHSSLKCAEKSDRPGTERRGLQWALRKSKKGPKGGSPSFSSKGKKCFFSELSGKESLGTVEEKGGTKD